MKDPSRLAVPGFIFVVAVFFFSLTMNVPNFADDNCWTAPVFRFDEVVDFTVERYLTWTGRIPVNFTTALLLKSGTVGQLTFGLVNTLCFAAVLWLSLTILRIPHEPRVDARRDLTLLSLILFCLWFTPDQFGEVVLWKTGATHYFWVIPLVLLLLRPLLVLLCRLVSDRGDVLGDGVQPNGAEPKGDSDQAETRTLQGNGRPGAVHLAIYASVAVVAACSLETLAVALAPVWAAALLWARYVAKARIPRLLIVGFLGWVTGTTILLTAPGNYVRAGLIGDPEDLLTKFAYVIGRLGGHLDGVLVLILACSIALTFALCLRPLRTQVVQAALLAAIGTLTGLAMVGAPIDSFVRRAAFPYEFFLLLAALTMFPQALVSHSRRAYRPARLAIFATCFGLVFAVAIDFAVVRTAYAKVREQETIRRGIIEVGVRAGEEEIVLPPLDFDAERNTAGGTVNEGRYFARDITRDPSHWRNTCYATANGAPAVVLGVTGR